MLKFNIDKPKRLVFDIVVEGISQSQLEYNLRLSTNKMEYGFKGINENGKVVVDIPPLASVLSENLISELKKVKLEINDIGNKYYSKPYEDTVKIEIEPKITLKVHEEVIEPVIESKVKILEDTTPTIEDITPEPVKQVKSNKFRKFLKE